MLCLELRPETSVDRRPLLFLARLIGGIRCECGDCLLDLHNVAKETDQLERHVVCRNSVFCRIEYDRMFDSNCAQANTSV